MFIIPTPFLITCTKKNNQTPPGFIIQYSSKLNQIPGNHNWHFSIILILTILEEVTSTLLGRYLWLMTHKDSIIPNDLFQGPNPD